MQNVLTCAQMRAADKYTIETLGVPSAELMERAGAAIAEEAEKLLRETGGRRVLAVCGGGNNGGGILGKNASSSFNLTYNLIYNLPF